MIGTADGVQPAERSGRRPVPDHQSRFACSANIGALELTANKRLSDRWMIQASWVISKITGNDQQQRASSATASSSMRPNYDPAFAAVQRRTAGRTTIRTSPRCSGPIRRRGTSTCPGRTSTPPEAPTPGWYVSPTSIRRRRTSSPSRAGRGASMASRSSTSRLRSDSGWQPGSLGVSFEAFNLFNNGAVNDRFTRTGAIFDQPQGAGLTATAPVRSDLPLLIATAVHDRSPLLFREAGFFVSTLLDSHPRGSD